MAEMSVKYINSLDTNAQLVRESTWYALGLFLRNGPGDVERAIRALGVILN